MRYRHIPEFFHRAVGLEALKGLLRHTSFDRSGSPAQRANSPPIFNLSESANKEANLHQGVHFHWADPSLSPTKMAHSKRIDNRG